MGVDHDNGRCDMAHHNLLEDGRRMRMLTTEYRYHRDGLKAMVRELETNRAILDELAHGYQMFLFMGGDVPQNLWSLVELKSYHESPIAGGTISIGELQRYLHLARAIVELGEEVANARPRSLRSRRPIADDFEAASSEIRALSRSLESVMTNILEDSATLKPAPIAVTIPVRRRPVFRAFSTRRDERSIALQSIERSETDGGRCR